MAWLKPVAGQRRGKAFPALQVGDQPAVDGILRAEVAEHHHCQNQEGRVFHEHQRAVDPVLSVGAIVPQAHAAEHHRADAATHNQEAQAHLPACRIAQGQKHHGRQHRPHREAGVEDIGSGGASAGKLVDHAVIKAGDAALAKADHGKGDEQEQGAACKGQHEVAQIGQGAQQHDGAALPQIQWHQPAEQSGQQVSCRVDGQQNAAQTVAQAVGALQVGHYAAHGQGKQTAAEEGVEAGEQGAAVIPLKAGSEG